MLGSSWGSRYRNTGLYRSTRLSGLYHLCSETSLGARRFVCELCEVRKRCFDDFGLRACAACHDELLPSHAVV